MKGTETLTEPLLDEGGSDAGARTKIPALNPEDPLFGLNDVQVKQSFDTFGKNEVSVDSSSYHISLFFLYLHTHKQSCTLYPLDICSRDTAMETLPQAIHWLSSNPY